MEKHALQNVDDFLKEARARRHSAGTLQQYAYAFGKLTAFLDGRAIRRFQDVAPDDLQDLQRELQEQGLSMGTQENLMRCTRKFFRWLTAGGWIFVDPTDNLAIPRRAHSLPVVPTEEEMGRLLAQPDTTRPIGIRDRALLEAAYGCGLRRSELAGLSVQDADLERATLRVQGKNGKERVVPLGKHALHWLKVYLEEARPKLLRDRLDETRIWITEQRTPMAGFSIWQQLRYYIKRGGIVTPMNLHSLRKACATHMLSHGAHPVDIQMLLGHAGLRHLGRYLRVTIRETKQTHDKSKPGH